MTRSPITLDPGRDPWDQQPHESAKQYGRFLHFREIGRVRSLTALNRLLTDLGDNLTYGTIRIQSHLFRWSERANAWDRHQDELNRARIAAARQDLVDKHLRIANSLLAKALAALKQTRSEDLDPLGIIRYIKLATDLETRALGAPDTTVSLTSPSGGPVQTEDLSALSPQERTARMRELMEELASRAGVYIAVSDDD